jgi:hypothetical protein
MRSGRQAFGHGCTQQMLGIVTRWEGKFGYGNPCEPLDIAQATRYTKDTRVMGPFRRIEDPWYLTAARKSKSDFSCMSFAHGGQPP